MADIWYDSLMVGTLPLDPVEREKIMKEETYITLTDVIDTRTNTYYSVAVVKERNAKWFVPAE